MDLMKTKVGFYVEHSAHFVQSVRWPPEALVLNDGDAGKPNGLSMKSCRGLLAQIYPGQIFRVILPELEDAYGISIWIAIDQFGAALTEPDTVFDGPALLGRQCWIEPGSHLGMLR